ncbi:MAG: cytochrome c1, partial [Planctomycetia bacterium]|nr:cytochrome c1 [Planctomycetia bacterium]
SDPPGRIDTTTRDNAARLIGQRGFGCLSCHVLAGRIPPGGEPETLGPDLALVSRRMTEGYFRRWIADPQRIIAGTPMPQYLKPVDGVPGALDDQLKALWQLLSSDSLSEVAATGTREILKREGDRAMVVRDMVLVPSLPGTPYTPRGLAVGFKNDVSLLFDTDRLGWLSAWQGGFLARTKTGRLWEWHPEGTPVWTSARRLAPVVLIKADGSVRLPAEDRERFGTFTELDFEGDGVRLRYRLRFADGPPIDVTEDVRPVDRGWSRTVGLAGVPEGSLPFLVEQPPDGARAVGDGSIYTWTEGPNAVTLRVDAVQGPRPSYPGEPGAVLTPCSPRPGNRFSGTEAVRLDRRP